MSHEKAQEAQEQNEPRWRDFLLVLADLALNGLAFLIGVPLFCALVIAMAPLAAIGLLVGLCGFHYDPDDFDGQDYPGM